VSGRAPESKMVEITMDGRVVLAPEDGTVLAAARAAGIEIPTLCDHPDLEPVGACRLCTVEITHPDWKGWSGLMTACLYPVSAGLQVSTAGPRVLEARRQVLTLLAARCPNSEPVRELADRYGVDTVGLWVDPEADNCILCGLCTRVCEAYATEAITTWSRGASKAIGTFADRPPEDCVGCGGCAIVCPTGHIEGTRTAGGYDIWGRSFPAALCVVDEARCSGCGACEEACPFSVARVAPAVGGLWLARIPEEHCRGCGACVGACPAGAITQEGRGFAGLLSRIADGGGRPAAVLACGRANLRTDGMPGTAHLVDLPCSGRVTSPLLLAALASGSEGVLVLGRQQQTCRLDGAEGPAVEALVRARRAADLVGLDGRRLRFEVPEPGGLGARRTVEAFAAHLAEIGPSRLREGAPAALLGEEGLDTALSLLAWLDEQPGLIPDAAAWLDGHGLPAPRPGGPVLAAGLVPHLDALAGSLLAPTSLPEMLRSALRLLERLGVKGAGIACGALTGAAIAKRSELREAGEVFVLSEADASALGALGIEANLLEGFLLERRADLAPPPAAVPVACDGLAGECALIEALGLEPVDAGPDPLPSSFIISPTERVAAEARLVRAEGHGATALLVRDPFTLARWALVTRQGSWRGSRVAPAMPHQIAALALEGEVAGFRALRGPVRPRAGQPGATA